MRWKTESRHGSVVHSCQSEAADWKALADDLVEYWLRLLDAVSTGYQKDSFDRLYFEFWIDSGRIIGYPNRRGEPLSSWKVAAQVVSPLVLRESEGLADPDANPEQFEIDAMALEAKMSIALRKASNDRGVRAAIKALRKAHDFTTWLQSADDVESARVFAIIA